MDLLAKGSANSTGSGRTPLKRHLTNTIRLSIDMKPIIYETSPDFLDTFLPPTAGHGRDRDDKYYHRRHDRRERMLFLFHIHFSCYIFLFFFSSYGKVH